MGNVGDPPDSGTTRPKACRHPSRITDPTRTICAKRASCVRTTLDVRAAQAAMQMSFAVSVLLAAGGDPNQRTVAGGTSLHLAACKLPLEVVSDLDH